MKYTGTISTIVLIRCILSASWFFMMCQLIIKMIPKSEEFTKIESYFQFVRSRFMSSLLIFLFLLSCLFLTMTQLYSTPNQINSQTSTQTQSSSKPTKKTYLDQLVHFLKTTLHWLKTQNKKLNTFENSAFYFYKSFLCSFFLMTLLFLLFAHQMLQKKHLLRFIRDFAKDHCNLQLYASSISGNPFLGVLIKNIPSGTFVEERDPNSEHNIHILVIHSLQEEDSPRRFVEKSMRYYQAHGANLAPEKTLHSFIPQLILAVFSFLFFVLGFIYSLN